MLLAVYGLGTCLSAPLVCLGCMVVLISMLLAGDGQVSYLTLRNAAYVARGRGTVLAIKGKYSFCTGPTRLAKAGNMPFYRTD
jgi:hypothetical protein